MKCERYDALRLWNMVKLLDNTLYKSHLRQTFWTLCCGVALKFVGSEMLAAKGGKKSKRCRSSESAGYGILTSFGPQHSGALTETRYQTVTISNVSAGNRQYMANTDCTTQPPILRGIVEDNIGYRPRRSVASLQPRATEVIYASPTRLGFF